MMLPIQRFIQFIRQNHLFTEHDGILAAVSGGMDSVLMAHLLKASGYRFAIAHCNFQLRGDDALADQQFCKDLARQLRVPFHTINFDTTAYASERKVSIQMAARNLRYQWFEYLRQQHGYAVTALAHHQNDAMETILLNLTRGTGIAGMHGILARNGNLVRPLLFLERSEIAALISENNLVYVEDSSNASVKYARNKIRLEVIPKLKELNPSLEKTFEHNLQHFRDLETLLQQQVSKLKEEFFIFDGDEIRIPVTAIKGLNPQRLLLYGLLSDFGFNETTIDDLIASLDKHSGRTFEADGHLIVLDRDQLIISYKDMAPIPVTIKPDTVLAYFGYYELNITHEQPTTIIRDNPFAIAIDTELLIYPLTIRSWQQGDFFYPLGMKTRKKLSDLFIQRKVPLHQKSQIPLLINGNGDIAWAGGLQPDERYKVSDNTKKVTIFELSKLK